jgi:hypothetical protein
MIYVIPTRLYNKFQHVIVHGYTGSVRKPFDRKKILKFELFHPFPVNAKLPRSRIGESRPRDRTFANDLGLTDSTWMLISLIH